MTVHAPGIAHPRIAQRRAAVDAATRAGEVRRRRLLWWALAVAILVLSGYLATRSEVLDVDRLEVNGAVNTSTEEIIAAAGIRTGEPLVGLDLADARSRVARLPWVKDVYSSRTWSGLVSFTVTERSPLAALATAGGWALVEENGRVLALEEQHSGTTVPIVGLNIARAAPGDWLEPAQRGAVLVAAELYEPVLGAVRSIQVGQQGYVLDLHNTGRVLLGDGGQMAAKVLAVHTFIERVDLHCMDTLDVRSPGTPVLTRKVPCQ